MIGRPATSARPALILYAARFAYAHKNAITATLAWIAESRQALLDVYYDAPRSGVHFGGGDPQAAGLSNLTGGLVSGGRHVERAALALQRFRTTIICSGYTSLSALFDTAAEDGAATVHRVQEESIVDLYDTVLTAFDVPWPTTAVMVNAAPSPQLDGIDAYCYPEILYRQVLGIEETVRRDELEALQAKGVRVILTCGVSSERRAVIAALGFQVEDLDVVRDGDDYAAVTCRLAERWQERRRGWIAGDPVLVSYWLPTACRERYTPIYSVPQVRVVEMLRESIAPNTSPVLGRQFDDRDFFLLSRLGQSFQLIDPCRPAFPVLEQVAPSWSPSAPDPRVGDPSDEQLRTYAREGRVLVSLAFWTGMIRETENLYALMDLFAVTNLRAGLALTAQSLAWRPSPLDLLTVPREQGGVFPNVEILLGSCGTGVAIESLLSPDHLRLHLRDAWRDLDRLEIPPAWRPEGWWALMDAQLQPRRGRDAPKPVRVTPSAPFLQVRYHPRNRDGVGVPRLPVGQGQEAHNHGSVGLGQSTPATLRHRLRTQVRDSQLRALFSAYRPYENDAPGPIAPGLASVVREAGFTYMLSKSGFDQPPHIVHRDGDFVALNYTAGQWDGWTPFETINTVRDLRQAEKTLVGRDRPGWLLGGIDTCLWAFSGELWHAASGLAEIARFIAKGGSSGKLINVTPRVLARYARIVDAMPQSPVQGSGV